MKKLEVEPRTKRPKFRNKNPKNQRLAKVCRTPGPKIILIILDKLPLRVTLKSAAFVARLFGKVA